MEEVQLSQENYVEEMKNIVKYFSTPFQYYNCPVEGHSNQESSLLCVGPSRSENFFSLHCPKCIQMK